MTDRPYDDKRQNDQMNNKTPKRKHFCKEIYVQCAMWKLNKQAAVIVMELLYKSTYKKIEGSIMYSFT